MRTRQELEAAEDRTLAPWAMRSSRTAGRRHPEDEHPYRTAYQRDRDRIVHCTAFRRLEYKTQVFLNSEGDEYRTRLTHTLEVAQLARTAARALGLNEELTEALALVHDLGHGPFGHAGEAALARCMKEHGGFEHNRQGLRIVELLEQRYPTFPGLNLTYEAREGMVKHGRYADKPEAVPYHPELGPLAEAQVADRADRMAYNHHDLDDALTAGILDEAAVREVSHVDAAFEAVDRCAPGMDFRMRVNQVVIRLLNEAVTDLVEESSRRLRLLTDPSPEAVRASPQPVVGFSAAGEARSEELHRFLFRRFYCHWQVARMQESGKRWVEAVFEFLVDHPRCVPPHAARRAEEDGLPQAVCDLVAAMTDRELIHEYRRIAMP